MIKVPGRDDMCRNAQRPRRRAYICSTEYCGQAGAKVNMASPKPEERTLKGALGTGGMPAYPPPLPTTQYAPSGTRRYLLR